MTDDVVVCPDRCSTMSTLMGKQISEGGSHVVSTAQSRHITTCRHMVVF